MAGLPLAFASPWVLLALLALPIIWYLLRLTPPKPRSEFFPPYVILERLKATEDTPAKSPWWLTLLRLAMAALAILAMAGPILNPGETPLKGEGPLLMVIDDGWASAGSTEIVQKTALSMLETAEESGRPVAIVKTTDPADVSLEPLRATEARGLLEAGSNRSVRPDHAIAAQRIRTAMATTTFGEAVFFSDGLTRNDGTRSLLDTLATIDGPLLVARPDTSSLVAVRPVENQPSSMTGTAIRADSGSSLPLRITAYDKNGLPLAIAQTLFSAGETETRFELAQPVEVRNQIVRIVAEGANNAGAVQLLDDSNRRRVVGLISGQSVDVSQPLLSPLYYINRALSPFSDLRFADTANTDEAVDDLLNQNVSAMVLADVGTLPVKAREQITEFLDKGGLVIRFAGPRLAANPASALLPVELVQGDRFIGGALSWETPKSVAPFEPASPFFGLDTPQDVSVSRQVLALQSQDLENRTWARLEDGTPLVTANQLGAGWLVLFHVNSDNNWSNLPLSGTFVEMLRRTVNLARSTSIGPLEDAQLRLPPMEVLDGKGVPVPPPVGVKPLVLEGNIEPRVTLENPPGLYGTEDGFRALNLIGEAETLTTLEEAMLPAKAQSTTLATSASLSLRPWLLLAAMVLFLADCLAVLWFAGLIRNASNARPRTVPAASAILLAAGLGLFASAGSFVSPAMAQSTAAEDGLDYSAALRTRFAYVVNGNDEIDRISRAGLLGLTRFVSSRTALEPGDPVGVDVSTDELSFYPFLYWAVDPAAPAPEEETMARVDAYMKQGGTVLFDTRDQISGVLNSGSGGNQKLREILATLDIPPLEPVPSDHVLTKAFFLLDSFPGRYQGGDLWVEQIGTADENETRPARAGDGVSTIMITSNDFAGAWAIDEQNRSLMPITPPVPGQREYAFRVGVNIVMYTMTGNYKADQVHVPALLERLGQ
ncbi:MAG: DUF4159 domain-containing protein [Nitratireductor sp.]|nr:DUF4159 domain-containing protein [Nitratireductor sp.]